MLLSEVVSPKDRPIRATPLAWRDFEPGQAALRRMLSDWARAQRRVVGRYEQNEDDVRKNQ